MDQTLINWLLGGFGALIGFLLNAVWQAVKDLQAGDKVLADKVAQIEVLVAGDYVKKDDFQSFTRDIFLRFDRHEDTMDKKFDRINTIVEKKVDKP